MQSVLYFLHRKIVYYYFVWYENKNEKSRFFSGNGFSIKKNNLIF